MAERRRLIVCRQRYISAVDGGWSVYLWWRVGGGYIGGGWVVGKSVVGAGGGPKPRLF